MDREYDLVVFGGTGVTGKFVMEELALHGGSIKWAVAGRRKSNLLSSLAEVTEITSVDLTEVGIILADVRDVSSLGRMCQATKVVVNCVGPFRFYGEQVVLSCLMNGTHYIDVCGEPQFLEDVQQKCFEEACRKGIYIIGACGFDSIPCDMGVEFLRQKFVRNSDGTTSGCLNSVESFLEFHSTKHSKINFGTWESAIHSLAHASELRKIRMKLREKVFPDGAMFSPFPLKQRPMLFRSEIVNKWCLPFMGSDRSVVIRSQLYRKQFENKKPVQIQTYFCVSSLLYALLFILMSGIFVILAKFETGRALLQRYPGFFSCGLVTKGAPTRKEVTGGSFTLTLCGTGWSKDEKVHCDKKMVVKVIGPDAGYVTTSICVVAACKTLLDEDESKKMAEGGGVFSPAAVFARTNLIKKLQDRGIIMTVVDEGNVMKQ